MGKRKLKKDILKYIETEKDISRFNIKTLERLRDISASKKRILEIEREFVSLSLESWDFEDISDVAAAISIYRSSRAMFYKTYPIKKPKSLNCDELKKLIKLKFNFIESLSRDFMWKKVNGMNLVQNDFLFDELSAMLAARGRKTKQEISSELENFSIQELNSLEPIALSKDRARMQATLYSVGMFLFNELAKIILPKNDDKEQYIRVVGKLDSIIDDLSFNIFKNYNLSLEILPNKFEKEIGHNNYFSKVHRLKNVLDFDNIIRDIQELPFLLNDNEFNFDGPTISSIVHKNKKIIGDGFSKEKRKNSKAKTLGILFPIPRIGNEKMTIMHTHVYVHGYNISDLFETSSSNIKVGLNDELVYFKALMLKPLWKILDSDIKKVKYEKVLSEVIGFPILTPELYDIKKNADKINQSPKRLVSLDKESIIWVPKTRSEEEAFGKIIPWIRNIYLDTKKDYYSTTNDDV